MRNLGIAALSVSILALAGCQPKATGPDLGQVLDRTVYALDYAANKTTAETAEAITDADLSDFTTVMKEVMNLDPRFYAKPIGINLQEDATFSGFTDTNMNNVKDAGDTQIFTVEIDAENSRLIATDTVSGKATSTRSAATGFIAGALIGRLIGRQRAAGVKPGAFSGRNVASRTDYNKARPSARSKARSGSSRGGK